jgi:hypothetical protein
MRLLSNNQKQLLFDYRLGLTTKTETAQAKALITYSKEAAEIHSKLKATLAPLDTVRSELCPDELAQKTIRRLVQLVNAERSIERQEKTAIRRRFWPNLAEVASIAAIILFAIGILIPTSSFARYQYNKRVCQRQLASIFNGINLYSFDFDGKLPAVTSDTSQPWHKVGYKGKENHSNTRNLFLLLKLGYLSRPSDFICCGRRQEGITPLEISQINDCYDFLSREQINYSFRIFCQLPVEMNLLAGQPLMADCNPVFENIRASLCQVHLDEKLSKTASMNHNRRGQNILFSDGRVDFQKTRHIGIPQDDIFTVQNIVEYRGNERPVCRSDLFLAP